MSARFRGWSANTELPRAFVQDLPGLFGLAARDIGPDGESARSAPTPQLCVWYALNVVSRDEPVSRPFCGFVDDPCHG
jgi:hypothetical protein